MKIDNLLGLALLLSGSLLVSACGGDKPPQANETDPKWVAQNSPRAKVAVVFVHGLFGDTVGTWTANDGKTFFKYLQEAPGIGDKVDMFAFGFTSNMIKAGSFDIQEAANKLHESMKYHGVHDYPATVYVTHSMGGLVVLRHLLTRRDLLEKARLIVFYATPQEGSQITTIAKSVADNPALEQMLPADRNGFLRQLNDEWRSLAARPPIVCGYEKLSTHGIMIVPWSSATRFCDAAPVAIAKADHISIVKPDRAGHDSLVLLVNALNTHVIGKQLEAKLETPDFTSKDGHLAYTYEPSARPPRLSNTGGSKLTFTLAQLSPELHLWPDTPKEIPPHQAVDMRIDFGVGANANEYHFVLKSDVTADMQVVVYLPNLDALRARQKKLMHAVKTELTAYLSDPATQQILQRLPVADPEASKRVVDIVRLTVAKHSPELPESAQWVMTADVLAASNWPRLAATALRFAEGASPLTANSASVRHLAGRIASQSGDPPVFKGIEIPSNKRPTDGMKLMFDTDQAPLSEQLAASLKTVPSLETYGLTLEGDIWRLKGDKDAAFTAYKAAATLAPTAYLSESLKVVGRAREPALPSQRMMTIPQTKAHDSPAVLDSKAMAKPAAKRDEKPSALPARAPR